MKFPKPLLWLFLTLCAFSLSAQTTGFNYQAVLRTNTYAPIGNQTGTATVSILNPVGTEIYRETHNISTDQLGLFNLIIGKGANPVGNFATVDWGSGGRFVKISVTANGNTYDFFPTELQAVPYAKVAEKTLQGDGDADPQNEIQTLSLSGNQLSLSNGGGNVALPTGTDAQTLTINGQNLSISNGNSVTLPANSSGWTDGAALTTTENSKKLGIGTATPQQKIHVHDADNSFSWMQMSSGASGATSGDGVFVGTVGSELKIENCEPGNITLGNCSDVNQLVITPSGNVEIAGQLKIAGGSPGAGKVLTSDVSGNAMWSTMPGTIAISRSFAGAISSSVPTISDTWQFIGPTSQVTVNGNQRIVITCTGILGKSNTTGAALENLLYIDCGIRPVGGILEVGGFLVVRPHFPANSAITNAYTSTRTVKPAAGIYEVGLALKCNPANYLNYNDWVQGTIMVINE